MVACRAWARPWHHGDDGGRLGQHGLLGCTKRLGRTDSLLGPCAGEGKQARLSQGEIWPMAIFQG
jgi:hypothetical protein